MTFLRDMKQTLTNGAKDVSKLAKLTIEDGAEQIKHQVRKNEMENTVDDLQDAYQKMKENVEDLFR